MKLSINVPWLRLSVGSHPLILGASNMDKCHIGSPVLVAKSATTASDNGLCLDRQSDYPIYARLPSEAKCGKMESDFDN